MRFERVAMGLAATALLAMAGCFFLGQVNPAARFQVAVERSEEEQATVKPEGERPDSLLEGEVINLNTASAADLQRLPGIGADRAQKIVDERQSGGPFATVEDLLRVDGIGSGILAGLRPYVSVK